VNTKIKISFRIIVSLNSPYERIFVIDVATKAHCRAAKAH